MIKIDAYTRIVLTVIACTLVIFVIQNALDMRKAVAAAGVSKVAICDKSGKYYADVLPVYTVGDRDAGVRMRVINVNKLG